MHSTNGSRCSRSMVLTSARQVIASGVSASRKRTRRFLPQAEHIPLMSRSAASGGDRKREKWPSASRS